VTTRRAFLRSLGLLAGAGLGAACRVPQDPDPPRGPWGATPDVAPASSVVPAEARPVSVFEHFLQGGINPWDTFYVVPEHGDPAAGGTFAGQQWWTYQDGPSNLPDRVAAYGIGGDLLQPFGADAAGKTVHLGPWLAALRDRPDLLARMRILVMRHGQFPHQTGNPLAMCGQPLGSPRLAGTAAHVQRAAGTAGVPRSVVLLPKETAVIGDNADACATVGPHGSAGRPLVLWMEADSGLHELLARNALGPRAEAHDALVRAYLDRFAARLDGPSGPVRAPALDQLLGVRDGLTDAPAIREWLGGAPLLGEGAVSCGDSFAVDQGGSAVALATRLITSPRGAQYVIAVDNGLVQGSFAGFDTHEEHIQHCAVNVPHAIRSLVDRINEPGEGDPSKLDLDQHMVAITTEFGRTPYKQGEFGLDHWPSGYVQVLLGGPIGEEQAGVVGAIGEDGVATDFITPADFRAAMLLAQGIWPFETESFAVGDISEGDDEVEAARYLRERVLGLSS